MRHRSPIWTKLAARGRFRVESVVETNGKIYDKISAPKIERSLLSDPLSVGNCISATLQVSILTDDVIDTTAPIIVKARITDDIQYSEWLEYGTFFVDVPDTDYDGLLTVSCYDAMLKTTQLYLSEGESSEGWPKSMKVCVEEIAARIGVGIDPRTKILYGADYLVSYPSGKTMQQVLGYIGAVHGGNWIITEENLLRLVPLIASPNETFNVIDEDYNTVITDDGHRLVYRLTEYERQDTQPALPGTALNSVIPVTHRITDKVHNPIVTSDGHYLVWGLDGSVDAVGGLINVPIVVGSITTGKTVTVSKVTMSDESSNTFSYGDDSGFELVIDANPYANANICKALYERFNGLVYSPFTATRACYDPATELGDWVKIGDTVCSVIYTMSISLDIDYRSDISAPSSNELARQYPFLTEVDKLKSKGLLDENTNYAGVTLNTQDGLTAKSTANTSETKAEVQLNGESLSFKAINGDGVMEDCIFYDSSINAYRIKSNVKIDGIQDQANAISALESAIADMQSTSGTAASDISELKKTVAGHTSSINEMQESVRAHTASIGTLESVRENHEQRITTNSEDIATLKTNVTSAQSAIVTLNTALCEAQGKIDSLIASDEQTATMVSDIQTDITDLKTASGTAASDISELKSTVENLQENVLTLEGTVADISSAIEGILVRLAALESGSANPDS
jgi:predicted  nucleic acid-binding Zn-ribbon protein